MWQLFQFPLCPFSRKVRLVLGEKGVAHELVRENPWERRDEFVDLNPAGETPVLVDSTAGIALIGSQPCQRILGSAPRCLVLHHHDGCNLATAQLERGRVRRFP